MARHLLTLAFAVCLAAPLAGQQTQAGGNALANATSRYLRDASASHVAWRPWSAATFDYARRGNRPLFVSLGIPSSWDCHRLHKEVFNNGEVAETLNGYFVPVLVDRFEHPEIAEAFDTLQKSMMGTVTMPSSFVIAPSFEPLAVSGLVTPREFNVVLATAASRWANDNAAAIAEGRQQLVKAHMIGEQRAPGDVDQTTLAAAIDNVAKTFDPKSPRPMSIAFALRYAEATDNKEVRAVALESLRSLARSARRDQIGGGFHRAAGAFDKTLADQALFALTYLDAWQLTRDPEFENVVRTTLDYVIRDLHRTKGAFDASQDAHGLVPGQGPEFINGAFYLWSRDEVERLLGRETALKIFHVYGFDAPTGNLPVQADRVTDDLKPALAKLLEYRQKRPEPFREFTEYAGWNGLFISALSRAGAAFGEQRYIDAAAVAARVLTSKLWVANKRMLYRSDAATAPVVEALPEDYAMVVQGLIDVFDATSDVTFLDFARSIQQRQDDLFWNASLGRYTTGTSLPEQLRGLVVESDEATPSVNALAASNLIRLSMLVPNETWRTRPATIFQAFGGRLRSAGGQLPQLASALSMSYATPKIVVVTGEPRTKTSFEARRAAHEPWHPLRAVIFVPEKGFERTKLTTALPFTAALAPEPKVPLTYVCEKGECRRQ